MNGKRVTGEQALKHGDEVTVGAVTLRVAKLGKPVSTLPASPESKPKAGDTAVVEALEVDSSARRRRIRDGIRRRRACARNRGYPPGR